MARVSYKDITITIICARYPRAVTDEIKKELKYCVTEKYPGIYVINGAPFPMKIVASNNMSTASRLWVANLRGDVREEDLLKMLEKDSVIKLVFDTSVFWYTMMKLIDKYGKKEEEEMSAQDAFRKIAVERGWDTAWEAKGEKKGSG